MALRSGAVIRIHVNGIVRTRLHARFAANAAVGIEIYDAVLALVHRRHRTYCDARRLFAVIAARHLKDAASVREDALLDVFDPGPVHSYRHLVLGLARDRTRVTADTLPVIDYEAVFHPEEVSSP